MLQDLFKLSNLLSLLRIFLMIPIIWLYALYMENQSSNFLVACGILIVLNASTDYFDGYFARKFNQVSELGKILDPIADKIGIASFILTLYYFEQIPLWIPAVIVGRDLLILIGAFFLMGKLKSVPSSEWPGKITAFLLSLLVIAYLLQNPFTIKVLLFLSMLSIAYSLLDYIMKFIKLNQEAKQNHEH